MSGSVNKVILVGNLGADPEIRNTQNGDKVASFSLATSESWKDQSGERQTKTEWHRIVVFGGLTQVIESYVKKGSKLFVEGQLRTRKWQDQSGVEKYTTEVVLTNFNGTMQMLDGNPNSAGAGGYQSNQNSQPQQNSSFSGGSDQGGQSTSNDVFSSTTSTDNSAISDLDDEIPF